MIRSIVISERVSVPVLSEQMTEAEPSVSTDESFLTTALRLAMRCTPSASTSDRIAGRPSGTAATASDTPSSSTVMTSEGLRMSDTSSTVATTMTAMTTTAMPSMRPMRHLLLQRRRLLHRGVEHGGDRAHLGLHAGRGDDGAAGPLRDRSALEHHVEPVGERRGVSQGGARG